MKKMKLDDIIDYHKKGNMLELANFQVIGDAHHKELAAFHQAAVDLLTELYDNKLNGNRGWIPCSERMPKDYGEYLVLIDGTAVQILFEPDYGECGEFGCWHNYYDPDTLGFVDIEWTRCEDVSHWMPLPEPPEEKTE